MQNPEQLLTAWQGWGDEFTARPRLVRALPGGLTNQTYLIETDDKRWALRVSSAITSHLGIDRYREREILNAAVAAKLAPRVAYCDPASGILITEFIEGEYFRIDKKNPDASRQRLLDLVHQIQLLDIDVPAIDYHAYAEQYWQRLVDAKDDIPSSLVESRATLASRIPAADTSCQQFRICHGDLIEDNIIDRDGQLYVIDWEYAARGWLAFDYAATAVEWQIPVPMLVEQSGVGRSHIEHAANLYRYICDLWKRLSALELARPA